MAFAKFITFSKRMTRFLILSLLFLVSFEGFAQKPKLVIPVGHTNMATSVSINPSGNLIASSEGANMVKIWDIEIRKELYTLPGHQEAVTTMAFHPVANFLASGSNDKSIIVWDLKKAQKRTVLNGHSDAVLKVKYSKDGLSIISSSADGSIRVWDANTGTLNNEIKIGLPVHCFGLSEGEDYLVAGTRTGAIFLIDYRGGKVLHQLAPGTQAINDIHFSQDGRKIIAADNLGKLYVINSTSAELIRTISAFDLRARQLEFVDKLDHVIAIGRDSKKNIRFFDIGTGEELNKDVEIISSTHPNFSFGTILNGAVKGLKSSANRKL
ncbi:MAG: WD40 repeat domain-containing protein [Flammeovirgaceae bacterium]|nr:WD40 repeat domain-containing protein [Flammeovirgaceae bacterium]